MTERDWGRWACNIDDCGEPAYHREVIDGVEYIRCPKHLQIHLGYRKEDDDKGQYNSE